MPAVCTLPGCSESHEARGWCAKHWRRWKRHGDPLHERPTPLQRWESKTDRSGGPEACWPWTGSLDDGEEGYGQFYADGRHIGAHRWTYQRFIGPIPPGQSVLHRCDNPPCCNPAHLFLGTNVENTADKMSKGRHRTPRGERVAGAKLTEDSVREIRRRAAEGEDGRALATEFLVSKATISLVISRKRWAHVA